MAIKALFFNFTFKKLPKVSSTQAPIKPVIIFKKSSVESQIVKVTDHRAAFGIFSDKRNEGEHTSGKVNIRYTPVATIPILFRVLASIATIAIERQGRTYMKGYAKPEKYPIKERLQELLLLELRAAHQTRSICDTTWHIFQGCPRNIPSL